MKWMIKLTTVSFSIIIFFSTATSQSLNGFDLKGALIPVDEIRRGGPPRDGIPSVDDPKFTTAPSATYPKDGDRVLGVYYKGVAKAYPIRIMDWHEIVNDTFNGHPVVITYCPLCGSGIAFDARIKGKDRTFGVSGLLYNSDVLLYDRQSASLWSQLLAKAVTGPLKGTELKIVSTANTTWRNWKKRYPETLVLTTETGYARDYARTPYGNYDRSTDIMFPVDNLDNTYHPKERVLGVEVDGKYKAYPFEELAKAGPRVKDNFSGKTLDIRYDKKNQIAEILNEAEQDINSFVSFWFAWAAFYEDTEVFRAD